MWWWWSSIQLKLEHNNFASARTRDSVKEFRFAINKCNNQSNVILRCARFHLYRTKTPISHFAWNSSRTKCTARIYIRDNKHDNPLFHIAVKRHKNLHTQTTHLWSVFLCVCDFTLLYMALDFRVARTIARALYVFIKHVKYCSNNMRGAQNHRANIEQHKKNIFNSNKKKITKKSPRPWTLTWVLNICSYYMRQMYVTAHLCCRGGKVFRLLYFFFVECASRVTLESDGNGSKPALHTTHMGVLGCHAAAVIIAPSHIYAHRTTYV